MAKFRNRDHVRVTNPDHHRFDQVLSVYDIVGGRIWVQANGSPELFTMDESDLTLADRERDS